MINYQMLAPTIALYEGDCREVLRQLPDNSIDSVPCDPPYALVSIVKRFGSPTAAPAKSEGATGVYMRASAGFMGQTWDTGETAMSAEFWAEVFRVLKPGGHVAAFGSTRGYHRMACAIEDAGFEIRDSLMWLYGTGFPKSHDVSKGIDEHLFGVWLDMDPARRKAYVTEMRAARATVGDEVTRKRAVDAVDRRWHVASGCARELVAPREQIAWQRDIGNMRPYMLDPNHQTVSEVSATPQAAEWEGWGTALKPAFEPIVLARKPLSEGTVAANVLRWRTGAINVDGCRIGTGEDRTSGGATGKRMDADEGYGGSWSDAQTGRERPSGGRFPANVVHDGSDEVVGMFPQAGAAGKVRRQSAHESNSRGDFAGVEKDFPFYGDSGSAARFFYNAKASRADRNGSKHPTVKPIALMRYLARLITPPGGVCLDPFAGSGTTGAACAAEGFACVMIEREAQYAADIRLRFVPSPSIVPT